MKAEEEMRTDERPLLQQYSITTALPFKVGLAWERRERKYERDGHWNEREKLKYTIFLTYFQALFQDPAKKKSVRIYDMMADMIITRTSNQCRSHHQKMEKYRSTIADIIASVAGKYEPGVYREMEQKYLVFIKVLLENSQKYTRHTSSQEKSLRKRHEPGVSQPIPANVALPAQESRQKVEERDEIKVVAKTADSYEEPPQEPALKEAESVPMMPLFDIKINEAPSEMELVMPACMMEKGYPHMPIGESGVEDMEVGYIYEQMRMLELKREWHIHNANLLQSQLMNEQNEIYSCGSAIQFYQRVLHSRP